MSDSWKTGISGIQTLTGRDYIHSCFLDNRECCSFNLIRSYVTPLQTIQSHMTGSQQTQMSVMLLHAQKYLKCSLHIHVLKLDHIFVEDFVTL